MRYFNGESMATDVVSALTAGVTGYVAANMALNGKSKCAFWTDAVAGVGGLVAKNFAASPMMHEILEGIGFGGFAGLGAWAAAVMAKKDNIPVWRPQAQTASVIASVPRYFPPPAPVAAAPAPAAAPATAGGNWEFEY